MKTILQLLLFLAPLIGFGQITQIGEDLYGEASGDSFGTTLSLNDDGTKMAVGAIYNSENGFWSGQVKIFENSDGVWTQLGQDINGETEGELSGGAVSLNASGTVIAIGAALNSENGMYSGKARVYEYQGGLWIQKGEDINGEGVDDRCGISVHLSANGNMLAVGSLLNDGNGEDSGEVRMFEFIDGMWTQVGNNIYGEAADDWSGTSVCLSDDGNVVAIGAANNDGNGEDSGQVRVYRFVEGVWIKVGQDIDGESAYDYSGSAISLSADGSIVAIGAPWNFGDSLKSGHVRVYKNIDEVWTQIGQDINGEAANDWSGSSVSLNAEGDIVAIGAYLNDGNGEDSGQIRIYRNMGGNWLQIGEDFEGDAENDNLGPVCLNANGRIVAMGAPNNDANGVNSGLARVFDLSTALGVDDTSPLNFSLYPIPTSGILHIHSETPITQIAIYNLMGQLVASNENQNSIDLSSLQQGVYFCKVKDENGHSASKKISKE